MNILLAYFGKNSMLEQARKQYSKMLYAKGHIIKELNGITDNGKAVGFQYAVIFIDAGGMFLPDYIPKLEIFLKNNENLCTKYISVYTNKKICSEKWLCRYMACLERFGVLIHDSAVFKNFAEAADKAAQLEPVIS